MLVEEAMLFDELGIGRMDILPLTRHSAEPYLYLPPVHVAAVLSMLALT
jgi:hypothetical protein